MLLVNIRKFFEGQFPAGGGEKGISHGNNFPFRGKFFGGIYQRNLTRGGNVSCDNVKNGLKLNKKLFFSTENKELH